MLMKDIKNCKLRTTILLSCFIVIITVFRIWLAYKTPIYVIADAMYDDYLFVEHADTILKGNWLGDFNFRTIAKIPGFSIYLALCSFVGVPFNVALILTFLLSIFVTVYALNKILNLKVFLLILYVLLLFNPLMFDAQIAQRVYRGGVILSFALMTVSSFIGLYVNRGERLRSTIAWSVLCCFSFTCFYVMKEDSIWLLPFCVCVVICLIASMFRERVLNLGSVILVVLPFLCVFCAMNSIASTNQDYYGIHATSDRGDSSFKLVIEDLNMIEDSNYSDNQWIWISRESIEKAFEFSPTLSLIQEQFNERYKDQVYESQDMSQGDRVDWILKDLVNEAGIYSRGGIEVEKFYNNIHEELSSAFASGQLNYKRGLTFSKMTPPMGSSEIKYTLKTTVKNIAECVLLGPVSSSNFVASGSGQQQQLFCEITLSPFAHDEDQLSQYNTIVTFDNFICKLYKVLAKFLFVLSVVSCALYVAFKVITTKKGRCLKINNEMTIVLVVIGLVLSLVGNVAAVSMFMRWLEESTCLLLYTGCVAIFVPVIETLCIYLGFVAVKNYIAEGNLKGSLDGKRDF